METLPGEEKSESRVIVAAVLTTFGTGAAFSFYWAGVGFFVLEFKSRAILPWMLLVSFGAFAMALLLQEKFDAVFDKKYSPRHTFFFRVMVLPFFSAAAIGVLALLCDSWGTVLACGFFLGFLYAANVAASLQMASSWDPLLVVWTQIGNTVGSASAVFTFFIFSFTASTASKMQFQWILLVPIVLCIMTSSILMYWHFKLDLFEHVYRRLEYDLSEDDNAPPLMIPLTRGTSAQKSLYQGDDVDSKGVPVWVPLYTFLHGLSFFMSFSVLPFATFFGDADLSQTLLLAKLAMDCGGRISALVWGYVFRDLAKPIHIEVTFQVICRLVVGIVLALVLLQAVSLQNELFLVLWCYFFASGTHLASQIEVLCGRCVVVSQRKASSRRNVLAAAMGKNCGIWLALAVVHSANMK